MLSLYITTSLISILELATPWSIISKKLPGSLGKIKSAAVWIAASNSKTCLFPSLKSISGSPVDDNVVVTTPLKVAVFIPVMLLLSASNLAASLGILTGPVKVAVSSAESPIVKLPSKSPSNAVLTLEVVTLASEPAAPVSPLGIVKLNVAADELPELVTEALEPALPVVVVPTAIVAAVPAAPVSPSSPVAPCGPTRLTADGQVPLAFGP